MPRSTEMTEAPESQREAEKRSTNRAPSAAGPRGSRSSPALLVSVTPFLYVTSVSSVASVT
jgi:hypothetical protein